MARPLRIEYPGAAYHVMCRGVAQGLIFLDDDDRRRFLDCLERAQEKFRLDIFAFVLMDNHYHLFLRTRQANLSRAIQWLQTAYGIYFNRRHKRSGHVFQGRFKAILVGGESYWTGLTLYVHLNPIRAKAAKRLADYPWSSYHDYVEPKKRYEWVACEEILSSGGRDLARQKELYRQSLAERAGEEKNILAEIRHGLILGSARFVAWVRKKFIGTAKAEKSAEVPVRKRLAEESAVERVVKGVMAEFRVGRGRVVKRKSKRRPDAARDVAVYLLKRRSTLGNRKIGELFGVTSGAVTKAALRAEKGWLADVKTRKKAERIADSIFSA